MYKIDNTFLQQLGLGTLPDDEKTAMLAHIYETLEMRVGIKLAEQMSDEQLREFEQLIGLKDDQAAFTWLETNFPNYKQVVADELEKLRAEIAAAAPQILAASQAQHNVQGQVQQPQPPQQPAPYDQQAYGATPSGYSTQQYQQPPVDPVSPPIAGSN